MKNRIISVLLILGLVVSYESLADDLSGPKPNKSLSPLEVVQTMMNALRQNDIPSPDYGISVTFKFSSPANRQQTGPLERFLEMVKGPVYGSMVNHRGATYENIKVRGERAKIDVFVKNRSNHYNGFRVLLSLQHSNRSAGSWMIDSVNPIGVMTS